MKRKNERCLKSRKTLLNSAASAVLLLLLVINGSCSKPKESPPNIVFFLVDDLGWRDLSFESGSYYQTPNIDRLADDGAVFTQAYAACAVCSPTRASILTGRNPARTGVTDWIRSKREGTVIGPDRKNPAGYKSIENKPLQTPENALFMDQDEVTIAEVLKERGYVTVHLGKWHLGSEEWLPTAQGFDYNIGGDDYGHTDNYFDPFLNNGEPIPSLPPRQAGEYMTDRLADEAVALISKHRNQPLFINFSFYNVHLPLQAKNENIAIFENKIPADGQNNPVYAAMIKSVDDAVGKIIDTITELGLAENTIFIFYSDNGGKIGVTDNSPLRAGKGYPYEGGLRVPLIIKWPGVTRPGTSVNEPVSSPDFLPTLSEAAGADLPPGIALDGTNLQPLLSGTPMNREALYWHFPHYRGRETTPYSIIRSGDWKLIKFWEGELELFNLADDPAESHNLAATNPEKTQELDSKLLQWLDEAGAKLPLKNSQI